MDKVGEYTLQVMRLAGWYNNWLFSFIEPHLGERILEVGVGIGNFTKLLSKKGEVTAIDIDRSYISKFKKAMGAKVQMGFGNIETGKYFFKKKKFDTVICLNVLEHIEKDKEALHNMLTLLQSRGKLTLLVPAHRFLYSRFDRNLGHYRRYDKLEVESYLKNVGFKEVKTRYLNWWAVLGWFVFLKLGGWSRMPKREVGIFNFLGRFFLWPEKYITLPLGLSVFAVAEKK